MTHWDIYGPADLERDIAKSDGPAWDALRALIEQLATTGADRVGIPAGYPWPSTLRYAAIEDDSAVYGAAEWLIEHGDHRIARILDVDWLPDVNA